MSQLTIKSIAPESLLDSPLFTKFFQDKISEQIVAIARIPDVDNFAFTSVDFDKSTLNGELLQAIIAMPFNALAVVPVSLHVTVGYDSKIVGDDTSDYFVKGATRSYKVDCKISVTKTANNPASTFVTESDVEFISETETKVYRIDAEQGMVLIEDEQLVEQILGAEEDSATLRLVSAQGGMGWESKQDYSNE